MSQPDNMESPTLTYAELCKISGYNEPAEVVAWLTANRVPYFVGKHRRPSTTTKALNTALGVEEQDTALSEITENYSVVPWRREGMTFIEWIEENWNNLLKHPKDIIRDSIEIKDYFTNSEEKSGIYFLLLNSQITYVGLSHSGIGQRINYHNKTKAFDAISIIELDWPRQNIFYIESFYIGWLDPADNISHQPVPHEIKIAIPLLTEAYGPPEPYLYRG